MRRKLEAKYQNSPVMSIRLPIWQQTALQMIANRQQITVTDIIRDCIDQRLKAEGLGYVQEVVDGQMNIGDYE